MIKLKDTTIDSIKKNTDDFSFISTFFDLVGNKEFKKAEIDTLYNNVESKTTAIWRSLSAVAENLGSEFYENILNFIDNVDNVDLCKVQQLQSIVDCLGIKYTLFNDIKYMPIEVVKLLDIFSVKREYLIDANKINHTFIESEMSACMCDDQQTLSALVSVCNDINYNRDVFAQNDSSVSDYYTEPVTFLTYISDDTLNTFMFEVYKSLLSDRVLQTYNDKACTPIYKKLSNEILLSNFTLTNDKYQEILDYKLINKIPLTFNVEEEVDKLETGETIVSDYNELEYGVLSIEIERRKDQYNSLELKTRYKYYREKEVQSYTEFIENEYNSVTTGLNYILNKKYSVDPRYIEVYLNEDKGDREYKFFKYGKATLSNDIVYDYDILSSVANQLVKVTNTIRDMRELVKVQSQKNFMYGTKLFLTYVIHEYLRNNIVQSLSSANYLNNFEYSIDDADVDTIEYYDSTDYNNISTENDDIISASCNQQYWKNKSKNTIIGAIDNTGLFLNLPTLTIDNGSFDKAALSTLYIDILNNKFNVYEYDVSALIDAMNEFLYSLFDAGAENTFIVDDIVQTYDSNRAKKEFEDISSFSNDYILSVSNQYKILSNDIPSALVQINTTLNTQLSTFKDIINSYNIKLNSSYSDINSAITKLSTVLFDSNDIKLTIPLSAVVRELNYKYSLKTAAKYDAYENALATDSYVKYKSLKDTKIKTNADYNNISVSYNKLIAFEEISNYIQNDLAVSEKSLSVQLDDIYLCIPNLISANPMRKANAFAAHTKLKTDISAAGELSSVIEITLILETLSTKYEELVNTKQYEYNDISSTPLYNYRKDLYFKYINNVSGDVPFYYLQNKDHPSYSLHPYLENYAEKTTTTYPIENIVNVDMSKICEMISDQISTLVDTDGYTVNVQMNPINSNSEYVSRYEHELVIIGKNASKVQSYDGFVYPEAFHDLTSNQIYTVSVNINEPLLSNILTGNFIDSLSGVKNDKDGEYYNFNPWYAHLDISQKQKERIALQLSVFKEDIKKMAAGQGSTSSFDIYRYGLDNYKNVYCLLKEHNGSDVDSNGNTVDDDVEMKNADGTIWMRYKDHPIPFPLYVFKRNTIAEYAIANQEYSVDERFSQITDVDSSNLEYNRLKLISLQAQHKWGDHTAHYMTPCYTDFTFTNDKNFMILNGKIDNSILASYPILVSIKKSYNAQTDLYETYHLPANATNQYTYLMDAKSISAMSNYVFESYFYDSNVVGVLYSSISCHESEDPGPGPEPEQYIELEYIQSTGTQYIDTNLHPNAYTQYKVTAMLTETKEDWLTIFGTRHSNEHGSYEYGRYTVRFSNKLNQCEGFFQRSPADTATRQEFYGITQTDALNKKITYRLLNNEVYGDETKYGTFNTPYNDSSFRTTLYLFALNTDGAPEDYGAGIRIYSAQYFDKDGNTIADFIPVKDSNNVICMYDKISKNYFYNKGSGTFIPGPEVVNVPFASGEQNDTKNDETVKLKISDIYLKGAYYEFGTKTQVNTIMSTLVDSVSSYNSYVENVCIDTNKYNVKVAYLVEKPNILSNYINMKPNFSRMELQYIDEQYFDYAIQTKDFVVGENTFISAGQKPFIKYTDIGCFGLNQGYNDLANTYLGKYEFKNRGVYNFLMISEAKDLTAAIDFRQLIPCRLYEKYNVAGNYHLTKTPTGSQFYVVNLLCAHYFEPLTGSQTSSMVDYSSLSSDHCIYDPLEMQVLFAGRLPYAKVDEVYYSKVKKALNSIGINRFDDAMQYVNHPQLYLKDMDGHREIPEKYYSPYKQNAGTDNCMFRIGDKSDAPYISASWCKYYDDDNKKWQIQLDFNTFFNTTTDDRLSINVLNNMNLFLNLEKAGDAGYLRVYNNPLSDNFANEFAQLYIKNISDNKPKFMLSVHEAVSAEYGLFTTDFFKLGDKLLSGYNIVAETELSTFIINEYVR